MGGKGKLQIDRMISVSFLAIRLCSFTYAMVYSYVKLRRKWITELSGRLVIRGALALEVLEVVPMVLSVVVVYAETVENSEVVAEEWESCFSGLISCDSGYGGGGSSSHSVQVRS